MTLLMPMIASVQRKVLSEFTFSDGLKVLAGDWVCVPWRAMMRDPQVFKNPMSFKPSRFLNDRMSNPQAKSTTRSFQLTDSDEQWLIWGAGRIRWWVLSQPMQVNPVVPQAES